ncbi:hypothetical protein KJ654_00690 [Patescibacteria group bacterium]|nr:hypothetical protein [Patescibacteria group bacterium]MBU1966757.1 hypothetical protein [Patescibacteria group bacterium]
MNIFKQKLEGFRHHQQIMTILVFTLVAVILWVAASLFSSQRRLGISPEQLKLSKPLTPVINTDVLLNLEQKQSFSNEELRKFPIYMLIKDQQQIEHIVEIGTKLEPLPSPIKIQNLYLAHRPQLPLIHRPQLPLIHHPWLPRVLKLMFL